MSCNCLKKPSENSQRVQFRDLYNYTKKCFGLVRRPARRHTIPSTAPLRAWVPFRESPSFETFTTVPSSPAPLRSLRARSPFRESLGFETSIKTLSRVELWETFNNNDSIQTFREAFSFGISRSKKKEIPKTNFICNGVSRLIEKYGNQPFLTKCCSKLSVFHSGSGVGGGLAKFGLLFLAGEPPCGSPADSGGRGSTGGTLEEL